MSVFERAAEAPLGEPSTSNQPAGAWAPSWSAADLREVLRVVIADVVGGLRHVSHHALAAVGLVAVVLLGFAVSRPDLRHALEDQALGWLTERVMMRSEGDVAVAPDEALLAMAEPDAIQRATAVNPAELNRQQAAVAFWIARRYSVAPEPISRLVQEAWVVGKRVGLDPTLVLAVMAVESSFNPFAQSHVGAANLPDDGGYGAKVLAEAAYLKQVAAGQKVAVNVTLPQASAAVVAPPAANAANEDLITPAIKAMESAMPAQAVPAAGESTPAPASPHRGEQVALLATGAASR